MDAAPVRFLAIIVGTILWYVGAVLQKRAVQILPPGRPRVADLAHSAGWMAGLAVTGIGWGLYMLGLERVPVSVARAITAGGSAVLSEPLAGHGPAGLLRITGILIVLGCSLLMGRFVQPVADGVRG
jgi:drug/metabolite transporter (DMT)-like permease